MKVTAFETTVVAVPYEENRVAKNLLLQLKTDDGLTGLAYVTPLVAWSMKPLQAAVEAMCERVLGQDPAAVESINAAFITRLIRPQFDGLARSAAGLIDIALWDLKAQAVGQPLFRLLGGADNTLPVYASWNLWWNYDIKTLAQHAVEHVERGFKAMKFRLGAVRTLEESAARTRALRDAVGP